MSGIPLSDIFFAIPSMKYAFIFALMLLADVVNAQVVTQTLKGTVRNSASQQPLTGASISLTAQDYNNGTVTDDAGKFALDDVPPGRYKVTISFTGFSPFQDEILVIGGKSAMLDVYLEETSTLLTELTFIGDAYGSTEPSSTTIPVEKTMRIPANFFDPVRMTTSYPGVVATNDQANGIIIKGNSPNGILWRLNGIDIVNPNHLSNAGTFSDKPMASGGGVNILSAQMLDRTIFHTGAFPVQYGNVLAGVLDMSLRPGNKAEAEYTAQASLIGIDLAAEGPFTQNEKNSYLVNYRYSTVGLLSQLGVQFGDEQISFQDLSFNADFDLKGGAAVKIFGLGGKSSNDFKAKAVEEIEEDKDKYNITYDAETYAVGLNYDQRLGKRGKLFFALGYSSSEHKRFQELIHDTPGPYTQLVSDQMRQLKQIFSSHLNIEFKPSKTLNLTFGVIANRQNDELENERVFDRVFPDAIVLSSFAEGNIIQPYFDAKWEISPLFTARGGMRYMRFTYNDMDAVEPRISLHYSASERNNFNISYRLTSQIQPAFMYALSYRKLELTKAHHAEIGHKFQWNESTAIKTDVYYQHLFDAPIGLHRTFSALNFAEITGLYGENFYLEYLFSNGTGNNYGINVTAEKSFYRNHYFILGASLYKSTYSALDSVQRPTRFDGRYTFTGTYGKEWRRQEKKRTIGLNTRLLYIGGLREQSVLTRYVTGGEPFYNPESFFDNKLKDYYRIDVRISLRKDKPRYTRTFAIDIQNVTGAKNEAYHYFDGTKNEVVTRYQLGIIPVLVYRIDF